MHDDAFASAPELRALEQRGAVALLAAATAVGSLGLAAGGTAGALLAEEMTGSTAWAGVPLGVLVAGSGLGALAVAATTDRVGRAAGLVVGYVGGAAGAALVLAAAAADSFALLVAGSFVLGAGNVAVFLARYAAADLAGETARGRALGTVFFGAAAGAVASPNLLGPSGELAEALGLPSLSGLYLVAIPSFLVAAALLGALPRTGGRGSPAPAERVTSRAVRASLRGGPARGAVVLLGAANLVMVAVMAIAPVHLLEHGHTLDFVGVAVGAHVLAMFAPSPLTGRLVDAVGSAAVARLGACVLAAAGLTGAMVDEAHGSGVVLMLTLLGLGWNAVVVAASTLLAASVPAAVRPRSEAVGEIAMSLAAGFGAPVAGVLVAVGDFTTLALAGAACALAALLAPAGRRTRP
jgi:MFS family permease